MIGIAGNILLVAFKAAVGLATGSVAVILDAVNNLSDALSSVITIVGTKLANKAPDKKHPFGYGRVEYLTSMLISVIVLAAGLLSFKESVAGIIKPEAAEYSTVSIIIIVGAIIVKLVMGFYVRGVGKRIDSVSLTAAGADAVSDAVLSAGTLAAAVISILWGLSLEGWFGAVISVFIIKTGLELLGETFNSIIGTRADNDLTSKLKEQIESYPGVRGCYDLTLHNYGPSSVIGSAHIEIPDEMNAKEIHKLTRGIVTDIYSRFGIILTVGIYASNDDAEAVKIKKDLENIVGKYPEILEMHGFYSDVDQMLVTFDLIIDFKADAQKIKENVIYELKKLHPDRSYYAVLDSDYSDR